MSLWAEERGRKKIHREFVILPMGGPDIRQSDSNRREYTDSSQLMTTIGAGKFIVK